MKPVYGFALCFVFVVAWWGAVYPEMSVNSGAIRVYNEAGEDISEQVKNQEIMKGIITADKNQIVFKSDFCKLFGVKKETTHEKTSKTEKNISKKVKNDDRRSHDNDSWFTVYFRREE